MMFFEQALEDSKVSDDDQKQFMSAVRGLKPSIVQDPGDSGM